MSSSVYLKLWHYKTSRMGVVVVVVVVVINKLTNNNFIEKFKSCQFIDFSTGFLDIKKA